MPMKPSLPILCALALQAWVPAHAQTPASGLQRCPSIEDPAARLACYDAAMPPTFASRRPPAAPNEPAPMASTTAAAAPAAPVRTAPPRASEAAFGLPKARDPNELESIESMTVPGFTQWGPNERIRLANGQVWQVTDGSSGALITTPSKVTIRKGLFGAYFMVFGERNRSPRVERVQ
jgi:hypothetical protein